MARETSAGAVLFRRDGNRVLYLLLHYTAGHWDFPKGNIEEGEKDQATVRREITEETGITSIAFIGPFMETLRYSYTWKGLSINKIVRMYLAETAESAVKLSDEHQGSAWLPYDEALERLTHEKSKSLLTLARTTIG